jgi:hypothetical protein
MSGARGGARAAVRAEAARAAAARAKAAGEKVVEARAAVAALPRTTCASSR